MTAPRRALFAAAAVVALVTAVLGGPGPASAKGKNLLPNTDFEESAIEPGPAAGKSPQPLLPTGWAFEGAAGLFDHSPNGGSGGSARAAAISIPLGGKRNVCADKPVGCNDNPATKPKNDAAAAVTVNPAWRNAEPIPVQAGKRYELSVDLAWQLATEGEGAFGIVRWMTDSGAAAGTAGVDVAPKLSEAFVVRSTAATSPARPWGRVSGVVEAPKNATSAVVLLGATDDAFIGQFKFDKAFFGGA